MSSLAENSVSIQIEVSRKERIFRCGEPVWFQVTVRSAEGEPVQSGELKLHFQNDFHDTICCQTADLAQANPVCVSETFSFPTFLTLTAQLGDVTQTASVGLEPERIEPGQPMPADFWPFWDERLSVQRNLTAPVTLEEITSHSTSSMTIFRVTVPTLDEQFRYGWLALPKKKQSPFPVLVMVPGAGAGSGPVRSYVSRGTAVLMMNVFPYPTDLNPDVRRDQFEAFERDQCGGRRYVWQNAANRETYFHRNSILAVSRAVDFLAELPEADPARIGFLGVSQGGFYGLALGALNPLVSAIVASIPGYCDHGASQQGRSPGGSKLYENVTDPAVRLVGPYFDGVNFARFIQTPIRLTVGFRDPTSNPSTVFAAFNQIPAAEKAILCEPLLGHETSEKHREALVWLSQKLGIEEVGNARNGRFPELPIVGTHGLKNLS